MKKKTQRLCVSVLAASMLAAAAVPTAMAASDMDGHWAQQAMQTFIDRGWLLGYGNGQYGPNDIMTREQFSLLLNRITGPGSEIADTSALTREQAMVMAAERLNLTATDAEVAYLSSQFIDADQISDSAIRSVAAMVAAGFVSGTDDGSLLPQEQMTRADGITFLNNMLTVLAFNPAEHDIIYGTATLTYAEYYSGDVTTTDNYRVDGVSSATVGMFNSFNGGMHTDYTAGAVEGEGYHILGVKKVNVAVSSEDYQAYKALNPSFQPIAGTPAQYKTVTIADGKAVYSATQFNVVQTVTDATATLQTGSTWGDYQIDITENSTANIRNNRSDEGWSINANIQGTILETADGLKVGMEYLQSMWVQPWEISFNVSEDSELNAHIVQWDNLPELAKLIGQKVTSITFIMPDSSYVYTFEDGIYIKPAYAGDEAVTASFTEGSTEVGINGVPDALENVTVTITCGSGRGKVTVADAVKIQDGKVTMDSGYDSTQLYTVNVSSDNYANITANFPATATQYAELEALAARAEALLNGAAAQDADVREHYEEVLEMLEERSATSAEAAELITDLTGHLSVYPDSTEDTAESAEGHGGHGGH